MEIQASEGVVFLLNLLLTFCIYTLPFIIIRFVIRKRPYTAAQAKRIVIIYGVVVWLIMTVAMIVTDGRVAGASVLLWSFINYKVLVSISRNEVRGAPEPENEHQEITVAYDEYDCEENEKPEAQDVTAHKVNHKRNIPKKIIRPIFALLIVAMFAATAYFAYSYGCDNSYDDGYTVGHKEGYTKGWEVGRDGGYSDGYKNGHSEGYVEGYITGHNSDTARKYQFSDQELWRAAYIDYIREHGVVD